MFIVLRYLPNPSHLCKALEFVTYGPPVRGGAISLNRQQLCVVITWGMWYIGSSVSTGYYRKPLYVSRFDTMNQNILIRSHAAAALQLVQLQNLPIINGWTRNGPEVFSRRHKASQRGGRKKLCHFDGNFCVILLNVSVSSVVNCQEKSDEQVITAVIFCTRAATTIL